MGAKGRCEDCLTYEVSQVEKEVRTTRDIYICILVYVRIHCPRQQQVIFHGVAPMREAAGCEACLSWGKVPLVELQAEVPYDIHQRLHQLQRSASRQHPIDRPRVNRF